MSGDHGLDQQVGAAASNWLAVYCIPGMDHSGPEFDASLAAQLEALEAWATWHETRGSTAPN